MLVLGPSLGVTQTLTHVNGKIVMLACWVKHFVLFCIPNNENVDLFKLRAFAENSLNVALMMEFFFVREETNLVKEKMLNITIFSLSGNVYKTSLQG